MIITDFFQVIIGGFFADNTHNPYKAKFFVQIFIVILSSIQQQFIYM